MSNMNLPHFNTFLKNHQMKKTLEEIIKLIGSYIGWLLVLSALGFYLYGIIEAINQTLRSTETKSVVYPAFLSNTIGSLQALLLTNLGVLLGISVTNPDSRVARTLRLSGPETKPTTNSMSPMELSQIIQLFGLIIFILCLIACLVTWIKKDLVEDSKLVVSVISESGKMFSAVVVAYIAAVFARRT
jgi:hypothetical protein